MKRRLQIWFLLLGILFHFTGIAQTSNVDLLVVRQDEAAYQDGLYDFRDYLYIYIDSVEDRTIHDVADESFQANFYHDSTNFFKKWIGDMGKEKACVWARLTIVSELNWEEDWLISINAGEVVLFVAYEGKNFVQNRTGTSLAVNQRPFSGHYGNLPCLPITLRAQDTLTVYFKLREVNSNIENDFLTIFDRALFRSEIYASKIRRAYFRDAIAVGILLAVAIYHFFIFFFQRQNVTLFFGFFVLMLSLIILSYGGYIHEVFFPNQSIRYGGTIVAVIFQIGYIFHYLFSRKYLLLSQILPKWDRVWGVLLIVQVLSTVLFAVTMISAGGVANANADYAYKVVVFRVLSPLPLLFYAMVVAVLAYLKGVKPAGLYFLAMSAYTFQHLAAQAGFDDIVNLPTWVFSFSGEVAMVLLFTLGIARQLKTLHDKKLLAEEVGKVEHAEALRLKELDEFKSRFYTNITHQFRTPLTIILGMADQIKDQPTTWLKRGTEMVRQNGLILLNLINQILDLSKLEAGVLPLQNVQGNILDYIKLLVEFFHSKAQQKLINLDFKSEREEVLMDYDPDKLSSIVTNLIDNAIKFTPEKGTVNLFVSVIDSDPRALKIVVKDSGAGISSEELPYIFDRFYQSESNNDLSAEGTGIGLALTKELVHLCNGRITVESSLETGTVFEVMLPITNEAILTEAIPKLEETRKTGGIRQEAHEELHDETSKPTVLIVEDNHDVIEYLSSVLQPNYILLTATDGEAGLETALTYIPDIIISDVMMPKMDGFEMTMKVKEDQRTSHIPIVLLTAKADTESRMEGLQMGADAYLTKPFNKKELYIRLEKLVELRNTLRQRYRDFRFLFEGEILSPKGKSRAEDAFIKNLQKLIETNMSNPGYGINDLCKDIGLSRSQLYRKFKALTNNSIADFIRKIRLHKARYLLRNTKLNVTEVSIEVGFKNLSTFSRSFSDLFGISPSMIVKQ